MAEREINSLRSNFWLFLTRIEGPKREQGFKRSYPTNHLVVIELIACRTFLRLLVTCAFVLSG
jgi:hypothetical protein